MRTDWIESPLISMYSIDITEGEQAFRAWMVFRDVNRCLYDVRLAFYRGTNDYKFNI